MNKLDPNNAGKLTACLIAGCEAPIHSPGGLCARHGKDANAAPVVADGARKNDSDKPPIHLVPLGLIKGAARAYGFGAKKYATYNFRQKPGLEYVRTARAAIGHLLDWLHGEDLDPESGLSHLDHAAASLGMLIDTVERVRAGHLQPDRDNRWKEQT